MRLLPPSVALVVAASAFAQVGQHLVYSVAGGAAGDQLGVSVALIGDGDGDGYADFAAGAPFDDTKGQDAGAVRVISGRDGRLRFVLFGTAAGDEFGRAVAAAGDVDKDGKPDFIVGAPRAGGSGRAWVFSGRDGRILHVLHGDGADDQFGYAVAGAGDVDGDGHADVLVGAPGDDNKGPSSGSARVHSGRDGKTIHAFDGDAAGDNFGNAVAAIGDVDADGNGDFAVAAYLHDQAGRDAGRVRLYSGKTGAVRFVFDGDSADDRFGVAVAGPGDVDGDMVPDVLAGAYLDDDNGRDAGSARVLSGKDGRALFTVHGETGGAHLGFSVAAARDIDRDGHADLLVGARLDAANGPEAGSARVYSGKDGVLEMLFVGEAAGDWLGAAVGGGGDVNGDGVPDLVVGVPRADGGGGDAGAVRVLSGRRLALAADTHQVSLSGRGRQQLSLDVGPVLGGRLYVLLGTLSGTSPGLRLGSITVPLNPDAYLELTVTLPNSRMLTGSLGILDPHGQAHATFTAIPELPATLRGQRLDHAFVVLGSLPFDLASNAVPLLLMQ